MTPESFLVFPGWIAFIAAIALVLAAYTALAAWLVNAVAERLARRLR